MSAKRRAVIVAARRTAVTPRGGALSHLQADELAAPVLTRLIRDAGLTPGNVDHVLLGNALYGGGNPARLAALRAGLPQSVPALTIDTQCCSGLDAILMGARMIETGAADCVLAGGTESFSRSPIRMRRPRTTDEDPVAYDRPPFAPPPFTDPDLAEAAAGLAQRMGISRKRQSDFAVRSHHRALAAEKATQDNLVFVDGGPGRDSFTRALSEKVAERAPVLAGVEETGVTAATIACEADGAAAVLLLAEDHPAAQAAPVLRILDDVSLGGDPADPALVPIAVAKALFSKGGIASRDLAVVELMEAYAVQAMVTAERLDLDLGSLNPLGGALARGHPIGASGAILAVQLFERLIRQESPTEGARSMGMALIAAAGGLGSGVLVEASVNKGG
ncbi:thiolase family protein [Roseibium sp.]|uniref:thiolase family protein n=1 Tax=Roseibium sp. TaxID=1936156 RepID=UPI003D12903B